MVRKATEKLRHSLDGLLVSKVKAGQSLDLIANKANIKRKEKTDKFSYSDAIVDWAIWNKGRGRGRSSKGKRGQKKGAEVTREDEQRANEAFHKWASKRRSESSIEFSDSADSIDDYTSTDRSRSRSRGDSRRRNRDRKRSGSSRKRDRKS